MLKFSLRVLSGAAALLMLASCGGGGDIAGDSSEFAVSPSEAKLTVTSATGSCADAAGSAPTVFTIIGGQEPFRIVNANPSGLIVDKTEATGKDPKFTVRPTGQCGDPFVITILDYHSKVVTVEYTVESEEPTDTTTPTE